MTAAEKQQLSEELAQAQAALTAATSPGGSSGLAKGPGGPPPAGVVALQLVKVLQQQVGNLEGRLAAQEKQRKALKKVGTFCSSFSFWCPRCAVALVGANPLNVSHMMCLQDSTM